tara:strand:+ start:42 stop:752 length:711 start_codon:yes stop_codon:yes gene_type:complete
MNIAICVSGSIRYPELGLKSINKIIPKDTKIFIHTWKNVKSGRFLKTIHRLQAKEGIKEMIDTDFDLLQYQYENLQVDDFDIVYERIQSLYDSIKFNSYGRNDVGILSMYYSIYQANKLKCEYEKSNDIIFDRVIRMRFDSDFVNELLDLRKTITFDLCIPDTRFDYTGINDQFAIGSSKTMDIYSNIYQDIHDLTECDYCGEEILKKQLDKHNITPTRIKFPVNKNNNIDFTRFL